MIDNRIEEFRRGDIVVLSNLNKRNIHKMITPELQYEVFDFYPSCLSNEQLWMVFYQPVHRIVNTSDVNANQFDFLLDRLRDEILKVRDEYQVFAIQTVLDLIALELNRSIPDSHAWTFNAAIFHISKSVQYIAEHFMEELSVSMLAEQCNYSPEHFSRQFRKFIGVSPIQYIINFRLENIVHLIHTENITVLDAAYRSGFRTSSAFYKAFRSYRSSSPRAYSEITKHLDNEHYSYTLTIDE